MLSQYGRYNFKYDASGLRYSKTTNDSSTYYYYNGDRLIGEDCLYGRIRYMYDHKEIVGARFFPSSGDMVEYEYIKDATGSVIAILKDSTIVAQYTYDAWGNIINQNINCSDVFAQINPIRYKGYYFDRETGLYYLQSRYYNPEIGAFISPDSVDYLDPENIGGLNLYCYCNNNPVMKFDPSGHFFISALICGAIIGFGIGAGASAVTQGMTNGWDNINGWQVLLDGTIGGVSGLLSATGIGTLGAATISGVLGFGGSVGGDLISSNGDWNSVNWGKAAIMGAVNFGLGVWAGAGSQNSSALGKELLNNSEVNRTFSILYNATNNYALGALSKRGFTGVFNLYSKQFINAVSKALPKTVLKLTSINLGKLGASSFVSGLLSSAF